MAEFISNSAISPWIRPNSVTSAAFLGSASSGLERHTEPLIVIWDNSPAHRGDAIRAYLTTPGLKLRVVNQPSYSPDFNTDEAIWGWVRQEVRANLCSGTKAAVRGKVDGFFTDLVHRREEVNRRCRTELQARARKATGSTNVDFTLASV